MIRSKIRSKIKKAIDQLRVENIEQFTHPTKPVQATNSDWWIRCNLALKIYITSLSDMSGFNCVSIFKSQNWRIYKIIYNFSHTKSSFLIRKRFVFKTVLIFYSNLVLQLIDKGIICVFAEALILGFSALQVILFPLSSRVGVNFITLFTVCALSIKKEVTYKMNIPDALRYL